MNLPDFILTDAPTLALIVRSKVAGELPATSFDDAWDALLAEGKEYSPSKEVEEWMRAEWNGVAFGAAPAGELAEIPQLPTISRTLARSWMPTFLTEFESSGGNASHAARVAKVDHSTPYDARKVDPVFAEAWLWAERRIADRLRAVMWERGVDGWDEAVFGSIGNYMDGPIGVIRKFDHSFIKQMATARCEELRATAKEGAGSINVSASASAKTETTVVVSKEQLEKRQARQRKKLEHQVERARLSLGTTNKN